MSRDGTIAARFRGQLGAFALDASFETPAQGFTALFGPSGCGKTTLLRCAAGLTRLPDGYFSLGNEIWQDGEQFRPPYARAIGYVFQEASLFAHLSVRQNLLYGYRRAVANGSQQHIKFDDVVGLLGVETLLERSPRRLSGGERQRVAVGRALLSQPKLLLMDEPLAALDRFSKDDILPYFEKLHAALAVPVLYVSHDLAEVERLADYIVLLERGRVVAAGALRDIQCDPGSPLARQPEAAVSLDGKIEAHDAAYGLTRLSVAGGTLLVPELDDAVGTIKRIRVRASDVSLARDAPTASSIINSLPARVLSSDSTGRHQVNVLIGLGADGAGARLLSRVTLKSWERLAIAPGSPVQAQIKGVALTSG
jgi:molybdate transport system ATP-binding protein